MAEGVNPAGAWLSREGDVVCASALIPGAGWRVLLTIDEQLAKAAGLPNLSRMLREMADQVDALADAAAAVKS